MYYGENSELGLCLWLGFVVGTLCENCCKRLRHLTTKINSARVYLGCGVGTPRENRENSENGLRVARVGVCTTWYYGENCEIGLCL